MMKKVKLLVYVFALLIFCANKNSFALNTSNSRSSNTVYALSAEEQYSASSVVWGMVDYQFGFNVNATYTLSLGLACPIRGGSVKLAAGAALELLADLHISNSVDLVIGAASGSTAYVDGNANVIFFHGNLTIPANRKIIFTDNTIIDCQGNDLYLDSGAQLIVSSGKELMIKNAVIKNLQGTSSSSGGIVLSSYNTLLTLDDVVLDLGDTYTLDQGYIKIRNKVTCRGEGKTFSFSYKLDTYPFHSNFIIIDKNSTLLFDMGTIFQYKQSSQYAYYNDGVTTYIPVLQVRQSLFMTDRSSKLHLNGCIFKVPVESRSIKYYVSPGPDQAFGAYDVGGIDLLRGTVIFDNRVIIDALKEDGSLPSDWPFNPSGPTIFTYYPAFQFGAGALPQYDIDLEILSGAKLETYGYFLGCNSA